MSPRVVYANLVVRLRSFVREKSAMFFTFALPIILVLVFGMIFTKPEKLSFDLHVQDLDDSEASRSMVERLAENGTFRITKVAPEADAAQYAREKKLNLMLVIPKGLEEMLTRRLSGKDKDAYVAVTYVQDPSSTSVLTKVQYLNAAVVEANLKVSGATPFVRVNEVSILSRKYRFIEFFVPGIIAMTVMTTSLGGALSINAELRQKGITRKLAATPLRRSEWLMANILYHLVLSVASTALILLVSYAAFGVELQISLWLPAMVLLSVFTFVGIGMMLTPLAKDAESAAAAGNAFLFPMLFLSGTFFPVEMMPPYLQAFARVLPQYYVNEGLRAAMIFSDHATALYCAAVVAAIAAVVFVAGSKMTRWEET